jgi:hypothetical protein
MDEIIDINLNDLEPVSINIDDNYNASSSKSSVSFGPGIELLMNEKKKNSNVSIDLGELDSLENELNELSSGSGPSMGGSISGGSSESKTFSGLSNLASNLFGGFTNNNEKSYNVEKSDSSIGKATKETAGNVKTWDGFSKIGDIPDKVNLTNQNMSDREKRRKKRLMLKKLEEWQSKGLLGNNYSHLNLDSSYEEIEDEYEGALEDKRRKDSIKLQGWWFMTFVNSIEYANAAFNPFDINLDGWGEQIAEDIDSYDEIFTELHEKYKGGKMAPELSLLLRLGFSAAVVNFTNKALSTATPGFNDVIKQSPELMKMFTNATVNTMSQKSPGFSFASNLLNTPDKINSSFGPPPPPVETKNQPPPTRPGMQFTQAPGNRQDLNAARGSMFKEEGVDIGNNYGSANSINNGISRPLNIPPTPTPPVRQEMRGPQNVDIENILSGLKTRNVNIHENNVSNSSNQPNVISSYQEDDSMISISSLKDIQNTNLPKRSNKRKNKSDKNTVFMDI